MCVYKPVSVCAAGAVAAKAVFAHGLLRWIRVKVGVYGKVIGFE